VRLHSRQLRADFWDDSGLAQLPLVARMLFQGTWALADDSGCLEDDPLAFKIKLFPSPLDADITVERLASCRDLLVNAGMLVPYEAGGKRLLYVHHFHKHQKLRNPSPPDVPLPPWVTWIPAPSNPRTGRYEIADDVLTSYLHRLTGGLQSASGTLEPMNPEPPSASPGPSDPPKPPASIAPPVEPAGAGDGHEGETDLGTLAGEAPKHSGGSANDDPGSAGGGYPSPRVRRRRPATDGGTPDPRVRPVIAAWCRRYREELGRDYPVPWGRDGAAIRRLPASYDVAAIEALIDAFWRSDDPFVRRVNPTIPAFLAVIGKLERIGALDGRAAPPPAVRDPPTGTLSPGDVAEIAEEAARGECW